MADPKVLSLGQCAADHGSITRLLRSRFRAQVLAAHTFDDARAQLAGGDVALVLVNRILDGTGDSGLDFICALKADAALAGIPIMLVSNYREVQDQAVALGALPGFGKDALNRPETVTALAAALQPSS